MEEGSKDSKDEDTASLSNPFSRMSVSGGTTTALKWLLKQNL